ncbi:MAG: tyrosine-type recombinase/integrase [Flavobacteriales bacterium]|jgi:integrase/recombinase XerD
MAKIKLVLDQRRPSQSGLYPLKFRVTHQTKSAEILSGIKAGLLEFDNRRECLIKKPEQNDLLFSQRKLLEQRLEAIHPDLLSSMSVTELRDALLQKKKQEFTVESFWKDEINRLIHCNRVGGARVYQLSLSAIGKMMKLNVPFSQISSRDIDQLESSMYQSGLKTNSIGVHMRTLKAICNKAIKQDLVDFGWYPFRKYTIRREKTIPRVLSLQELKRYFNLNIPAHSPYYRSWCIGKLLFYCRGMNIRDALKLTPDNIKAGRIIYRRSKTGKMYSVAITPAIAELLQTLIGNGTLLGVMTPDELADNDTCIQRFHQCSKVINHHLAKLSEMVKSNEVITTYVFRYTYANIAKQLGYSKDLIAEALGHEYGNKVTGIYLEQFDQSVIDEMNLCVCNSLCEEYAPF